MAQTTMFRDQGVGGDPVGAADLARLFRSVFGAVANLGPLKGALSELAVSAGGATRVVQVSSGQAILRGWWFENSETHSFSLAENASGNPRIDRIIVRLTFATQLAEITSITGTPAASPAPPDLVQNTTNWDIPLANVQVASGAASFSSGDITDTREFCAFAHQAAFQHWVFLGTSMNLGMQQLGGGVDCAFYDLTAYGVPSNSEAAYVQLYVENTRDSDIHWAIFIGSSGTNTCGHFIVPGGHDYRLNVVVMLSEGEFHVCPTDWGNTSIVRATLLAYRSD